LIYKGVKLPPADFHTVSLLKLSQDVYLAHALDFHRPDFFGVGSESGSIHKKISTTRKKGAPITPFFLGAGIPVEA
jgi:hypothetical protein